MTSRTGGASSTRTTRSRTAKPPIAPGLLKTRAYEELRSRILNDDLSPGSFLAERQLARQLGMSKTPVKAALERLQYEGFITISPQQGIMVRDLTVQEIADQYQLREALETYTLTTLAGKLSDPQIDKLRSNLRAQQAIIGRHDVPQGVALDTEFHLLFAQFLGNQEIRSIMSQLRDKMQRIITRVFHFNPTRIDTSYDEHLAIAEAVITGNGSRAAELLAAHLDRGRRMILFPRNS